MRRTACVVRRAQLTEAFARAQNVCTVRHCRSRTPEKIPTAPETTGVQGFSVENCRFFVRVRPVAWCIHRRRGPPPAYSRGDHSKEQPRLLSRSKGSFT